MQKIIDNFWPVAIIIAVICLAVYSINDIIKIGERDRICKDTCFPLQVWRYNPCTCADYSNGKLIKPSLEAK